MHMIFYSADSQRCAFQLFGNCTEIIMEAFTEAEISQKRSAIFGGEDRVNINRRKRLRHDAPILTITLAVACSRNRVAVRIHLVWNSPG